MSLPSKAASSELSELLKRKIESRTAKVGVIGMGYVGLPLALLFSEQKFPVTGFDIDKRKIAVLQSSGVLHLPDCAHRDPGGARAGLHRDRRLRQYRPHGCHHHLRSHSAERVPRARSQLHHCHRRIDCPTSARSASCIVSRAPPIPAPPKKFWCKLSERLNNRGLLGQLALSQGARSNFRRHGRRNAPVAQPGLAGAHGVVGLVLNGKGNAIATDAGTSQ